MMNGTLFTYTEGYLRVEFRPLSYGDYEIDLHFNADGVVRTPCDDDFVMGQPKIQFASDLHVVAETSSTTSSFFKDMLAWLEAILCDVQECAFTWEAEGPEGSLRWFNHFDNRGRLHLTWGGTRKRPGTVDRSFLLGREQTVRAFYEALRSLASSKTYDRLEHEPVTIAECVECILDEEDQLAFPAALATRDRKEADALIDALLNHAFDKHLGFPRRAPLSHFLASAGNILCCEPKDRTAVVERIEPDWDTWSPERRHRHVLNSIYASDAWFSCGERLIDLRSQRIEDWLARQYRNS